LGINTKYHEEEKRKNIITGEIKETRVIQKREREKVTDSSH
jgi:hypothetical protein